MTGIGENTLAQPVKPPLRERCACLAKLVKNRLTLTAHRSWGETFRLVTLRGTWDLRSPLFCLCGSGTTGCHEKFHGGARLKAEWKWRSTVYEEDWWSGELLQTYGPHSPGLYEYGYWLVTDRDGHEMIREGM